MNLQAEQATLTDILPLRKQFLSANNFQIRYNAVHERGWSDSWLLFSGSEISGYASVKGREDLTDRDAIFEFYLLPPFRKIASLFFEELLTASRAKLIECQSNEPLLTAMLYEFSKNIQAEAVLFGDDVKTEFSIPGCIFRQREAGDLAIFEHQMEPVGDYVLELYGEVVATGGFLLHYNPPFADLYMEVREDYRRQGLGTFLLQELKKECYGAGRVPAARCNVQNKASKAALLKAGMKVAGFILSGRIPD